MSQNTQSAGVPRRTWRKREKNHKSESAGIPMSLTLENVIKRNFYPGSYQPKMPLSSLSFNNMFKALSDCVDKDWLKFKHYFRVAYRTQFQFEIGLLWLFLLYLVMISSGVPCWHVDFSPANININLVANIEENVTCAAWLVLWLVLLYSVLDAQAIRLTACEIHLRLRFFN